ncbi:tyrosinase family protein [Noviherbaspirillum sedimenti]|uniref:Tyrosinase family protein n=1 Tax=Noviherbaspirillum sedimenti TaxID=2320865 RepID=A0A3A3G021_9BURK|nr:tyrosinase family protein [Noviherbaspirillum sedimenti]RJG01264.1 tyrosinase family protein [Noviherbaspirillum sedimenti]
MQSYKLTRRDFIKGTSALLVAGIPGRDLLAQTTPVQRLDWNTFKTTRNYASLLDAIARMRANTNAADKRSWSYWINVHQNFCPHDIPYFLSWHRGYLYYFEQQLRAVSGNKSLVLPYWDYYINPSLPPEFTNPASYNPLYAPRMNTNVIDALTMAPFASTVTNMQRGLPNAFETSFENMPHNPVHNILGNAMATMQSPTDPIFWLHHANVDRLWSAWQQAGGGRTTPPANNSYWSGNLTYATRLSLARVTTISTGSLNYSYQNESMPSSLPVAARDNAGGIMLASMKEDQQLAQLGPRTSARTARLLSRPVNGKFQSSGARNVSDGQSLGGVLNVQLNEASVSAELGVETGSVDLLERTLAQIDGAPAAPATPYRSVLLVLDSVSISDSGRNGGFFYNVYINLPSNTDVTNAEATNLVGSIGPFEIAGAEHRAHMNMGRSGSNPGTARLTFPLTAPLREMIAENPRSLTISFIRVSGDTSPAGTVISIGEVRLELSRQDDQ